MKRDYLDIANKYGTPLYVFDTDEFEKRAKIVKEAVGEKVNCCFSIKANPFLLYKFPNVFTNLEVCSPGELTICEKMNVDMKKVIFSGVNKEEVDIERAMDDGVGVFTAESHLHMELIEKCAAKRDGCVPVLLRLTGGSQFGMDETCLKDIIRHRESDYPHTDIVGIHYFTGTQKKKASVIEKELKLLEEFANSVNDELGFAFKKMEYGPGLNVDYFGAAPDEYEMELLKECAEYIKAFGEKYELTIEMGRFFAATSGVHLTTVMDVKTNMGCNYAICDTGINQLHYDGQIKGMQTPDITLLNGEEKGEAQRYVLCGSLCTTADVLASYNTPNLQIGDVLAFNRVGAYSIYEGMANFLSRELPGVVLINDAETKLVRRERATDSFNTPDVYLD